LRPKRSDFQVGTNSCQEDGAQAYFTQSQDETLYLISGSRGTDIPDFGYSIIIFYPAIDLRQF